MARTLLLGLTTWWRVSPSSTVSPISRPARAPSHSASCLARSAHATSTRTVPCFACLTSSSRLETLLLYTRSREYSCKKRGGNHLRPVGKKCTGQSDDLDIADWTAPTDDADDASHAGSSDCMASWIRWTRSKHNPRSHKMTTTMTLTQRSRISQQRTKAHRHPPYSTCGSTPAPTVHRSHPKAKLHLYIAQTCGSKESDSDTGKSKQRKRKGKKCGVRTADDIVIREIDWGTERKSAKYEDYITQLLRGPSQSFWDGSHHMGRRWAHLTTLPYCRPTYSTHTGDTCMPFRLQSQAGRQTIQYCAACQTDTCTETADYQMSKEIFKHIKFCAYCYKAITAPRRSVAASAGYSHSRLQ